jgi:hypothetical protein
MPPKKQTAAQKKKEAEEAAAAAAAAAEEESKTAAAAAATTPPSSPKKGSRVSPRKTVEPERFGVLTEAQQKLNVQKAKEQKQKEVSCLHSCHNR